MQLRQLCGLWLWCVLLAVDCLTLRIAAQRYNNHTVNSVFALNSFSVTIRPRTRSVFWLFLPLLD